MTTKRPSTGLGAEVGVDGRPYEAAEDRERRQARELEASTDRFIEAQRAKVDKKEEYRVYRPRYEALRGMAHASVAHRSNESAATRRTALRRHPVYLSLPESERRAWDELVDPWTETIFGGDLGSVWRHAGELADRQASGSALAEWDPPAETGIPEELAALIPRG